MIDDLSLHNPLALVVPPVTARSVAVFTLPIITDLTLVVDLSDSLLSARADAVGDLNQLENIILFPKMAVSHHSPMTKKKHNTTSWGRKFHSHISSTA